MTPDDTPDGPQLLAQMKRQAASGDANAKPNVITYSAAINACARTGEWRRALDLLDAMQARNDMTCHRVRRISSRHDNEASLLSTGARRDDAERGDPARPHHLQLGAQRVPRRRRAARGEQPAQPNNPPPRSWLFVRLFVCLFVCCGTD